MSQYESLNISFGTANSFSLPIDLPQDDARHPSSTFCSSVNSTVTINPAAIQKHLDSALKRIAHLSQSLDQAESDNHILENRVDSLNHQLSLSKLKEEALSSENTTLKQKLEAAPPSEITSLKNQLAALQRALDRQISKHNQYADTMSVKLATAKGIFSIIFIPL